MHCRRFRVSNQTMHCYCMYKIKLSALSRPHNWDNIKQKIYCFYYSLILVFSIVRPDLAFKWLCRYFKETRRPATENMRFDGFSSTGNYASSNLHAGFCGAAPILSQKSLWRITVIRVWFISSCDVAAHGAPNPLCMINPPVPCKWLII